MHVTILAEHFRSSLAVMGGEDKAALLVTRPQETWSQEEETLRKSLLNTLALLELVSKSVTVTPGAAAASVSLQDWIDYRMSDEVRFKENDRGSVVLEKIATSFPASEPIAALDDQSLGARKAEKAKPMRRELGQQIERELRSEKWRGNLSMRVHFFCEDYLMWRNQFETVESLVEWYEYLRHNPDAEGSPHIAGMRALHAALDKLEPDLAEAESNRVQLEVLKQTQKEIEHQKDVFQEQVETHYSTIAKLLRLPDRIDDMLMETTKKIIHQVGQDRVGMEELLTKAVTTAMREVDHRLKDMLDKATEMTMQETKWLCMYVCMYVCIYGALGIEKTSSMYYFEYICIRTST